MTRNAWDQQLAETDADHRALMRWLEQGPGRPAPQDTAAHAHNWAVRACAYDLARSVPEDPKQATWRGYVALARAFCVGAEKLLAAALEDPTVDPKEVRKLGALVARFPALAQGLPTEQHVHVHGLSPELERQLADLTVQLAACGLLEEPPK